ncbi:hypothetical protein J0S82_016698, partial [Galemys pyrenaicus]
MPPLWKNLHSNACSCDKQVPMPQNKTKKPPRKTLEERQECLKVKSELLVVNEPKKTTVITGALPDHVHIIPENQNLTWKNQLTKTYIGGFHTSLEISKSTPLSDNFNFRRHSALQEQQTLGRLKSLEALIDKLKQENVKITENHFTIYEVTMLQSKSVDCCSPFDDNESTGTVKSLITNPKEEGREGSTNIELTGIQSDLEEQTEKQQPRGRRAPAEEEEKTVPAIEGRREASSRRPPRRDRDWDSVLAVTLTGRSTKGPGPGGVAARKGGWEIQIEVLAHPEGLTEETCGTLQQQQPTAHSNSTKVVMNCIRRWNREQQKHVSWLLSDKRADRENVSSSKKEVKLCKSLQHKPRDKTSALLVPQVPNQVISQNQINEHNSVLTHQNGMVNVEKQFKAYRLNKGNGRAYMVRKKDQSIMGTLVVECCGGMHLKGSSIIQYGMAMHLRGSSALGLQLFTGPCVPSCHNCSQEMGLRSTVSKHQTKATYPIWRCPNKKGLELMARWQAKSLDPTHCSCRYLRQEPLRGQSSSPQQQSEGWDGQHQMLNQRATDVAAQRGSAAGGSPRAGAGLVEETMFLSAALAHGPHALGQCGNHWLPPSRLASACSLGPSLTTGVGGGANRDMNITRFSEEIPIIHIVLVLPCEPLLICVWKLQSLVEQPSWYLKLGGAGPLRRTPGSAQLGFSRLQAQNTKRSRHAGVERSAAAATEHAQKPGGSVPARQLEHYSSARGRGRRRSRPGRGGGAASSSRDRHHQAVEELVGRERPSFHLERPAPAFGKKTIRCRGRCPEAACDARGRSCPRAERSRTRERTPGGNSVQPRIPTLLVSSPGLQRRFWKDRRGTEGRLRAWARTRTLAPRTPSRRRRRGQWAGRPQCIREARKTGVGRPPGAQLPGGYWRREERAPSLFGGGGDLNLESAVWCGVETGRPRVGMPECTKCRENDWIMGAVAGRGSGSPHPSLLCSDSLSRMPDECRMRGTECSDTSSYSARRVCVRAHLYCRKWCWYGHPESGKISFSYYCSAISQRHLTCQALGTFRRHKSVKPGLCLPEATAQHEMQAVQEISVVKGYALEKYGQQFDKINFLITNQQVYDDRNREHVRDLHFSALRVNHNALPPSTRNCWIFNEEEDAVINCGAKVMAKMLPQLLSTPHVTSCHFEDEPEQVDSAVYNYDPDLIAFESVHIGLPRQFIE